MKEHRENLIWALLICAYFYVIYVVFAALC